MFKDRLINSWADLNKSLFSALKVERNVMFIILSLIILIAAFNIISGLTILVKNKTRDIAILKSIGVQNNSITNKDRLSQASTKSIKKVIYKPQPYRIILKLSGANPSAPAETVTEALRKAGIEFEVEKIERFNEKKLFKDSSFKRKEF